MSRTRRLSIRARTSWTCCSAIRRTTGLSSTRATCGDVGQSADFPSPSRRTTLCDWIPLSHKWCGTYTTVRVDNNNCLNVVPLPALLDALWTIKRWQYISDHNSGKSWWIFYNFCIVVSRKKCFTHAWHKCPPHLNNVLTLPSENETSHFIPLQCTLRILPAALSWMTDQMA